MACQFRLLLRLPNTLLSAADARMKKKSSPQPLDDDLRPEYGPDFFKNMKPNRFAGMELRFKGQPSVFLDEDVADVCDSSEAVSKARVASMSDVTRQLL